MSYFAKIAGQIAVAAGATISHQISSHQKKRSFAMKTPEDLMEDTYQYTPRRDNLNWDRQRSNVGPNAGKTTIVLVATPRLDDEDEVREVCSHLQDNVLDYCNEDLRIVYENNEMLGSLLKKHLDIQGNATFRKEDRLIAKDFLDPSSPYNAKRSECDKMVYENDKKCYDTVFLSYFKRNLDPQDKKIVIFCPVTFVTYCYWKIHSKLPENVLNHIRVRKNSLTTFQLNQDGTVDQLGLGDTCFRPWKSFSTHV